MSVGGERPEQLEHQLRPVGKHIVAGLPVVHDGARVRSGTLRRGGHRGFTRPSGGDLVLDRDVVPGASQGQGLQEGRHWVRPGPVVEER